MTRRPAAPKHTGKSPPRGERTPAKRSKWDNSGFDPSAPVERHPIPLWPAFAITFLCGVVYLGVGSGWTFRFQQSTYNHHILTAYAWLQGRVYLTAADIESQYIRNYFGRAGRAVPDHWVRDELWQAYRESMAPGLRKKNYSEAQIDQESRRTLNRAFHDWVHLGDRYYAYWPPLPAMIALPFVAVSGPGASDILIANLLGTATAFFVFLMLRGLKPLWPSLTAPGCAALTLFYCLGTCHMYQACLGQVWYLTQLAGTLMLIISAWLGLKAIERPAWLIPAGAALGLGFLGRNTIILAAPMFAGILWMAVRSSRDWMRRYLGWGTGFALTLFAAIGVQLGLNNARFGDPLDFGQGHLADQGGNRRFKDEFKQYGRFNWYYLDRNLYYYFVNPWLREYPVRTPPKGGWTFDPMGNSLFLISPPMLYFFLCWRQKRRDLLAAVLAGAIPGTVALMFFHGTGWYQFGQRYLLDTMPLLLVLAAFGVRGRLTWPLGGMILWSFAVNAWGTYRFSLEQV